MNSNLKYGGQLSKRLKLKRKLEYITVIVVVIIGQSFSIQRVS